MQSTVFWGPGIIARRPGLLTLENGWLTLSSEGRQIFSVPAPSPGLLRWPWYGMNAAFRLRVTGQKYSVTFCNPAVRGMQHNALDTGAYWKRTLDAGAPPAEGARGWIRGVGCFTEALRVLRAGMGALLGMVMIADPDQGAFPIYRLLGIVIVLGCLVVACQGIRNWRNLAIRQRQR